MKYMKDNIESKIPTIDRKIPAILSTATFALG